MRLSAAAELAIRGIMVLTQHHGEGPTTLDTICSEANLPKQYLTKIFGSLAKMNLITPIRGKHGGYMLARAPEAITLLEIVEAVEGPVVLNYCQHDPSQCDRVDCRIRPVWTELQDIIRTKLGAITMADAVAEKAVK